MLAARIVVTALAVAMTTLVTMLPTMPLMTAMVIMVVMVVMVVMKQRIEGDEGGDRRHVIVTVMRIGRCAGQRQYDQAANRHNS